MLVKCDKCGVMYMKGDCCHEHELRSILEKGERLPWWLSDIKDLLLMSHGLPHDAAKAANQMAQQGPGARHGRNP